MKTWINNSAPLQWIVYFHFTFTSYCFHFPQAIIRAFLKGLIDSLKGGISLFYLDRKINERVSYERKKQTELGRRKKSYQPSQIKYGIEIVFCDFIFTQLFLFINILRVFRDGKVLSRVLQCCLLNGGIFWLSIVAFEYLVIPGLRYLLLTLVLGHSSIAKSVWSWTEPFLEFTFSALWVVPLFLLSKFINTLYFQVFKVHWIIFFTSSSFSDTMYFVAGYSWFSLLVYCWKSSFSNKSQ